MASNRNNIECKKRLYKWCQELLNQAEIHKLAHSEDSEKRGMAVVLLFSNFVDLPDKKQGWQDMNQLIQDEYYPVQSGALIALGSVFPHVPDKAQAWEVLFRLAKNDNINVQWYATKALGLAFPHVPDKEQAYKDLIQLTKDEEMFVRWHAIKALSLAFPHVPDKEQAYKDLIPLTEDKEWLVRNGAGEALGSAFPHVLDKEQAWEDLYRFTQEEDYFLRSGAALALGSAFPYVPDKEQAWEVLVRLAKDEDYSVRGDAALALGSAFPYVPDKEQAWEVLVRLAKDEDSSVRKSAGVGFSCFARYYKENKKFEKAYQCFYEASSAFKYGLLERIMPKPEFYLYKGFDYYYRGRALLSELPDIEPEKYALNIKKAVNFFYNSIKYIERSNEGDYEPETRFFPICFNIYSAYYEYTLSFLNLDDKRINKVQNYLNEALKHCNIIGTKKGENIVKMFEKLTKTLKLCLIELEQEKKKQEADTKGKGGGWDTKYENFIDNIRKDFENHFAELDEFLNEIEAPLFRKIAEIEIENLERLKLKSGDKLPKSFWQRSYVFIKKIWKAIVAIGVILAMLVEIIKNWDFISEFIKNL